MCSARRASLSPHDVIPRRKEPAAFATQARSSLFLKERSFRSFLSCQIYSRPPFYLESRVLFVACSGRERSLNHADFVLIILCRHLLPNWSAGAQDYCRRSGIAGRYSFRSATQSDRWGYRAKCSASSASFEERNGRKHTYDFPPKCFEDVAGLELYLHPADIWSSQVLSRQFYSLVCVLELDIYLKKSFASSYHAVLDSLSPGTSRLTLPAVSMSSMSPLENFSACARDKSAVNVPEFVSFVYVFEFQYLSLEI